MKNGYRIFWTDHALDELEKTLEYLETNLRERNLKIISKNRKYC